MAAEKSRPGASTENLASAMQPPSGPCFENAPGVAAPANHFDPKSDAIEEEKLNVVAPLQPPHTKMTSSVIFPTQGQNTPSSAFMQPAPSHGAGMAQSVAAMHQNLLFTSTAGNAGAT